MCTIGQTKQPSVDHFQTIYCQTCKEWFPHTISRRAHGKSVHGPEDGISFHLDPRKMSVSQLRDELRKQGLSATGNKLHLVKRLSGALV